MDIRLLPGRIWYSWSTQLRCRGPCTHKPMTTRCHVSASVIFSNWFYRLASTQMSTWHIDLHSSIQTTVSKLRNSSYVRARDRESKREREREWIYSSVLSRVVCFFFLQSLLPSKATAWSTGFSAEFEVDEKFIAYTYRFKHANTKKDFASPKHQIYVNCCLFSCRSIAVQTAYNFNSIHSR